MWMSAKQIEKIYPREYYILEFPNTCSIFCPIGIFILFFPYGFAVQVEWWWIVEKVNVKWHIYTILASYIIVENYAFTA